MGLHISDIREFYEKGHYTYKDNNAEVNLKRLPEDYIFDEDLSVRRNRELVAGHNKKIDYYRKNKYEKQTELDKKLTNDVVEYIKEYYELTDKQARIVESWVYREKHAFMCDYFSSIDTFAEFADDLINYAD